MSVLRLKIIRFVDLRRGEPVPKKSESVCLVQVFLGVECSRGCWTLLLERLKDSEKLGLTVEYFPVQ